MFRDAIKFVESRIDELQKEIAQLDKAKEILRQVQANYGDDVKPEGEE